LLAALFDFVCFFLVFFLVAIRAVYHRHKCGTKPRWLYRAAARRLHSYPPATALNGMRRKKLKPPIFVATCDAAD
jgi:hypothetical protein